MSDRYERIREALDMGPTPGARRAQGQSVLAPHGLTIRGLLAERDALAAQVDEAVRLLRELAKDFEALARKEEIDPRRTAEEVDANWRETMLSLHASIPVKIREQHGGREDE